MAKNISNSGSSAKTTGKALNSYTARLAVKSREQKSAVAKAEAGTAAPKDSVAKSAELASAKVEKAEKVDSMGATSSETANKGSEAAERAELKKQIDELKKQIDELKASKKAKAKPAQAAKPAAAPKPAAPKPAQAHNPVAAPKAPSVAPVTSTDPDTELQNLARQVFGYKSNPLQNGQANAQPSGAINGNASAGAAQYVGQVSGNQGDILKSNLIKKATQMKSQGFQPKMETRALVALALGQDLFAQEQNAFPSTTALPQQFGVLALR